MAETDYKCLYSVGPGSVGPGTSVRFSALDPDRNSGVLTMMHHNSSGLVPNDLAALYQKSPTVFPGTSIALRDTTVRQMTDQLALIVSRYGKSSGAGGFRTVQTRATGGYRQELYWKAGDDYTKNKDHYQNRDPEKPLKPHHTISIPLINITWSDVVYSTPRPIINPSLVGKVNSAQTVIDGYTHAKNSLKYGGAYIRHDKNGGYDRWTIRHTATYDPYYLWRTSEPPVRKEKRDDGTYNFTLVNNGNGEQYHDEASFSGVT